MVFECATRIWSGDLRREGPGLAHRRNVGRGSGHLRVRADNRSLRGRSLPDEREMRFEQLFRSEADAVRSYALRRADPADADDVVAETFLVAWRRFDDMPSDPRPWLLGVARRVRRQPAAFGPTAGVTV